MNEVTGPVIAITLVLSSVFLPRALLGGITGQFFRQFGNTVIAAVVPTTIVPATAVAAKRPAPACMGSGLAFGAPERQRRAQLDTLFTNRSAR